MGTGATIVNLGLDILMDRLITASPAKTAISQFQVGIGTTTPAVADTGLEIAVPIDNGTVNDNGDNTLTGSSGGDNTTDNTTTFKPGAGTTDVTAQDLIANNSSVTKIWTIADLSALGTNITGTQPFALWFFIKDAAALAKLKTSGTALEVKLGSDSSNYFSKTFAVSTLATGFNWITSNTVNVNALTETGTVSGNIDTFIIEVTTNNATDTFTTGDVIYDLLRQWAASDLVKNMESGFPSDDTTTKEVTSRMILLSTEANGFPLTELAVFNTDSTIQIWSHDVFTSRSKTDTEEFRFIQKDRFIIV